MSALTKTSHIAVTFFPGHFVIQDIKNMKMIGKGSQITDLYVFHAPSSDCFFINTVSYTLGTTALVICLISV